MKSFKLATLTLLLLSSVAFGAIEVGDAVEDMCWKNDKSEEICLSDHPNSVRVLIYNAGF